VHLWQAIALGATGGFVVEFVSMWGYLTNWQSARRDHLRRGKKPLPKLGHYVDIPADGLVAITRILMGAAAGWAFYPQAAGPLAAIAVGAAAPALLRQFKGARTIDGAMQRAEALGEAPPSQPSLSSQPSDRTLHSSTETGSATQ
jgi:hypothetical protein